MKKGKIDWLNHGLEFFVVLIGILIAFQLNKFSESNVEQKLLRSHKESIKLECIANADILESAIVHVDMQIKYCDSLLAEIVRRDQIKSIRSYSTRLLDMRNVELKRNAYQVLTQSGDIRYMEDYEQKRSIISMYDGFNRINRINQSNQKLYDNHFYPYLKSNFDLVNWRYIDINSKADEEKYYAKEYGNTISTYKYLLSAKLDVYKEEYEVIQRYIEEG